jgi:hypothetical protein
MFDYAGIEPTTYCVGSEYTIIISPLMSPLLRYKPTYELHIRRTGHTHHAGLVGEMCIVYSIADNIP